MRILDRYVADIYLKLIGICLGSFVAIYLVIDFLEKFKRFSEKQAAVGDMLLFFLYKIPEIVVQVIPLTVLMATLLAIGTLARSSELTAMRSSGLSLPSITRMLLAIAFMVSLLTILANEFVVPRSYAEMKFIEEVRIQRKGINTFFRQQNIWFRDDNIILQARLFNPGKQTLQGVTLWQMGADMSPVGRIDAAMARWDGKSWTLEKGLERSIANGSVTRTAPLASRQVPLDLKIADLKVVDKSADNMGFLELSRYCRKLSEGGYDPTRFEVLMHSKLSLPFASFIMAFLGIPFAMRGGRTSGMAVGVAVSLGIGFGYFVINAMLLSFGQTGVLPPFIAAWSANIIFALTGIWLAMTVNH